MLRRIVVGELEYVRRLALDDVAGHALSTGRRGAVRLPSPPHAAVARMERLIRSPIMVIHRTATGT